MSSKTSFSNTLDDKVLKLFKKIVQSRMTKANEAEDERRLWEERRAVLREEIEQPTQQYAAGEDDESEDESKSDDEEKEDRSRKSNDDTDEDRPWMERVIATTSTIVKRKIKQPQQRGCSARQGKLLHSPDDSFSAWNGNEVVN